MVTCSGGPETTAARFPSSATSAAAAGTDTVCGVSVLGSIWDTLPPARVTQTLPAQTVTAVGCVPSASEPAARPFAGSIRTSDASLEIAVPPPVSRAAAAAAPIATAPTAATKKTRDRPRRRDARTGAMTAAPPSAERAASTRAPQVGQRSSGTFAIPLPRTSSIALGNPGRRSLTGAGASSRCA